MEEQTQNSVNLEIPSRWRRFSAYSLDLIINITGIWLIINVIIIISKKTTLWNEVIWIKTLNQDNKKVSLRKSSLRYFVFYQTFPLFIFWLDMVYTLFWMANHICIWHWDNGSDFCGSNTIGIILSYIFYALSIVLIINIIEIFQSCPTFIDKRLWIKRIYKKSK